jgi:hypothetical protein
MMTLPIDAPQCSGFPLDYAVSALTNMRIMKYEQ